MTHEVITPKLPDEDFAGAVRIAQADLDRQQWVLKYVNLLPAM
jgi:hypothetical protein